jgi:thioredoxin reductase
VRDKAIGILGSGLSSVHQALLFRQLTDDVIYLAHRMPPDAEQASQLTARDIQVVEDEVASLEIVRDRLRGVRLADGNVVDRDAVVVSTRMTAHARFLADLGLKPTDHSSGLGEHINVDPSGLTDVPGVWAVGNVTDPAAQVGSSAAAGAWAGARINADLVQEDTSKALTEREATTLA